MTKKDYVLIALILKDTLQATRFRNEKAGVINTCIAIARALARENPRFNADRFLSAVYGQDGSDSSLKDLEKLLIPPRSTR